MENISSVIPIARNIRKIEHNLEISINFENTYESFTRKFHY